MYCGLLFFYIFNYFRNRAMKYFAQVVDFHCAYTVAFFHSVNGGTADIVFVYKSVGCDVFGFKGFPKRLIAYQQ